MCAFQAIIPKTTDWRTYDARYVWDSAEPALEPSYSTTTPVSYTHLDVYKRQDGGFAHRSSTNSADFAREMQTMM